MENKQVIISISREFGSAGHEIAERLAKKFDLPFYDRNLLDEIAGEKKVDVKNLQRYDEAPKNSFLTRTVRGHSSSPEINIAEMQFDWIKKKAQTGESFVIVGRCSETVLKGHEGLITIFILGNMETKIDRIMERYHLDRKDAISKINRHDRNRKAYHNHHSDMKWGDSRNYDLCINSSILGEEETISILEDYIRKRMEQG